MVIRQSITAFILTTIISLLTILLDNKTRSINWLLLGCVITAISCGLPNLIFLLLIYWLKIGQSILIKTKCLLAEIILLNLIIMAVDKTVLLIPIEYRYYSTPTEYGKRFAFQASAIIFYSFVILFIVIFAIEQIKKYRTLR